MPSCIILSRQKLPTMDRGRYASADQLAKGAYVLADADGGDPELLLLATGSEVSLALGAHEQLAAEGVRSRVVSMPCWASFEQQPKAIATRCCPHISAPASRWSSELAGWDRYVGPRRDRDDEHIRRVRSVCETQGEVRFHNSPLVEVARQGNDHGEGMMVNRLCALEAEGQAVWLDYLDRSFLAEGGLKRLIEEDGLKGMTSNPSIFEKAIGQGGDYDEDRRALARAISSRAQIYEALAIADIQAAADVPPCLRPAGRRGRLCQPGGLALSGDGHRGDDRRGPAALARRGPAEPDDQGAGDPAGTPAIRQLIGEGLNINVTLLFGLDAYLAVADAPSWRAWRR